MSSIVDTKKKKQISAEEEEEGENNTQNFRAAAAVTSHIQLKQPAANSGDTLDKDVVLRRIRHRRRVNRLKSTVKAFLGLGSSSAYNKDKHNKQSGVNPPPTSQMISWVDDAFAAP